MRASLFGRIRSRAATLCLGAALAVACACSDSGARAVESSRVAQAPAGVFDSATAAPKLSTPQPRAESATDVRAPQPTPEPTPVPTPVPMPVPAPVVGPRCPAPAANGYAAPTQRLAVAAPPVSALGAVVIDGDSGAVLWGRAEHTPAQPASTTKIVTALLAIELGDLDALVPAVSDDRSFDIPTRMGLVRGDLFTLRDLLYGLLLPSGNDAAAVIAQYIAGDIPRFATLMNERVCRLGLSESVFINPSGLGRGEYNFTSPYDLAQVARYALTLPEFTRIVGTRSYVARGSRTLTLYNLNDLLGAYAGADGVKIGWTPSAGNTIVGSATRNGHRVVVTLMHTANRAGESAALLAWAFATFSWPDSP